MLDKKLHINALRKTCIAALLEFLAAVTAISSPAQTRTIEYPSYNRLVTANETTKHHKHKHPDIHVVSVTLDSLQTRVTVRYDFNSTVLSDRYGNISTNVYLIYAKDWQHVLLPIESVYGAILHDPGEFMEFPEKKYKAGDSFEVTLEFPAIPDDVDKIDIIGLNDFNLQIADIDLTHGNSLEGREIGTRDKSEIMTPTKFNEGSMNDLSHYISRRLIYPDMERNAGKEGKVLFGITVNENNSVLLTILESDSVQFEKEATRTMAECRGKFKATRIYGIPVKTYFTFPVIFTLKAPATLP